MDWFNSSLQIVQQRASEAAEQARTLASQASIKAVQVAGQATEQVKVLAKSTAEEAQARLHELRLDVSRGNAGQAPADKEAELLAYGLSSELIGFLQSLTYSTFSDFPVQTLIPDGEEHPNYKLNKWQEKHALLSLQTVEQLHNLRFVLCPKRMDEDMFWMIYFALTKRYLPPEVLEPDAPAEEPASTTAKAVSAAAPKAPSSHSDDDLDDAQLVELENDAELDAYLNEALADSPGDATPDLGSDVDDLEDYISQLHDEVEGKK